MTDLERNANYIGLQEFTKNMYNLYADLDKDILCWVCKGLNLSKPMSEFNSALVLMLNDSIDFDWHTKKQMERVLRLTYTFRGFNEDFRADELAAISNRTWDNIFAGSDYEIGIMPIHVTVKSYYNKDILKDRYKGFVDSLASALFVVVLTAAVEEQGISIDNISILDKIRNTLVGNTDMRGLLKY